VIIDRLSILTAIRKLAFLLFFSSLVTGCDFLTHRSSSFYTNIFGSFVIRFESDGDCSYSVNGIDHSNSSMTTIFEPYSESEFHQRQANENSSSFKLGKLKCYKTRRNEYTEYQRNVYDVRFDPSTIKENSALYRNYQHRRK